MGENQRDPTEEILRLTLEILLLLTGQEYFVSKKPEGKETKNILQADLHVAPDRSVIHNKKVLELTRRMMELLTREVPIRCQDVAVYLSMEEWEYVEGHKDLYPDIMEDPRPRSSPDDIYGDPPPPGRCEGHSPNIYPPTDHIQQSPPIKEEPVTCNRRNLTQCTQQNPISSIKEEPRSCDGRVLPDTIIHRPIDLHTQHSSYKEEPRSCDGGDVKDQRIAAPDPTQQHLKGEQDGGTTTTPNVSEGHVQGVVLCSGRNLISSAQPNPTTSATEGTNPPVTPGPVRDLLSVQFSCSECRKCFASVAELVSHQGVHLAEKVLQSRSHVVTTTIVQVAQVAPVRHKLLTCATCGRTFYTKSSLVGHMKTHWGRVSETFRCDYCGKSFSTKSPLNLHMRVHFGFRPYACTLCGERFKRTCDLGRHQKKHQ